MKGQNVTLASDEPSRPHRAFGSGKVIRGDSYGHVEVTAIPLAESLDAQVEWQVAGQSIPDQYRAPVLRALRHFLDSAVQTGSLRCGVHLVVEDGSYHPHAVSAHTEAAEIAATDALRRGGFTQNV